MAVVASVLPAPDAYMTVGRRGLATVPDLSFPAMVVGPRCEPSRARPPWRGELLVCLDGSRRAEAVLPVAVAWAAALDLDLALLHVVSPGDAAVLAHHAFTNDLLESNYLARAAAGVVRQGVGASWEVLHGSPVTALVAHAEHGRAALLALNTHGATTPSRTRHGRVPGRLVLNSPVPVLLTGQTQPPPPPVRAVAPPAPAATARRTRQHHGPLTLTGAARSYQTLTSVVGLRRAEQRPTPVSRRRILMTAVVASAIAVAITMLAPTPYNAVAGETRPADVLLSVAASGNEVSSSRILVTIVRSRPATPLAAIRAWLDPSVDVQRRRELGGYSAEWERQQNRQRMVDAGATAAGIALRHLGIDRRSVHVAVEPHGLGGPSAGLAFALQIVDELSPGDLTLGRVVAVTGSLGSDGRVGPVGGIRYKAAAADDAGASILLVPRGQEQEAARGAGDLHVIPGGTFEEALAALATPGP